MGNNPSHFKGTNLPVENVSWNDCQPFLAELQNKTGRKFALPTEAQWEYACRASTTNLYSCGDDETNLAEHAWYASNSDLKTHPVGQKKPNAWGFTTCTATCLNGAPTGIPIPIPKGMRPTHWGRRRANAGWFAGARALRFRRPALRRPQLQPAGRSRQRIRIAMRDVGGCDPSLWS